MGQFATDEVKHPAFARNELSEEQKTKMSVMDRLGSTLMIELDGILPQSREASLAKTKLEEVIFWANKSIVKNP